MSQAGTLFITATPIGNLKDWSTRAIDTAKTVEIIACEDTRVTSVLLAHYGIKKPLVSYHEHNAQRERPKLLEALRGGKNIMLVSDAGTPLISDPGFKLVREAQDGNIPVVTVPGPSSVIAALSICGLPTDHFLFIGFLPPKREACRKELSRWQNISATLIAFETAPRLLETLNAIEEILPGREIAVARELTKKFESVRRGMPLEIASQFSEETLKGEIVLVIAPPLKEENLSEEEGQLLKLLPLLLSKLSVRDAADIAADITGFPRKKAYTCALQLKTGN